MKIIATLALTGALLAGCTTAGVVADKPNVPVSSAPVVPIPTAASPAPPKTYDLGQTVLYTHAAVPVLTMIASDAVYTTTPSTSFGKPPKFGRFLEVLITAKADDHLPAAEQAKVNAFDFEVVDAAGTAYRYGGGNSLMGTDMASPLSPRTLNAGEQTRGTVAFDVPNGPIRLVYVPDHRALGYWTLP